MPLAVATQEKILSSEYEVEHIWAQHPSYEMSAAEDIGTPGRMSIGLVT